MLPATTSVASTRPEFRNQRTLKSRCGGLGTNKPGKRQRLRMSKPMITKPQPSEPEFVLRHGNQEMSAQRASNEAGNDQPQQPACPNVSSSPVSPPGKDPGQNFAVFTVTTTVTGENPRMSSMDAEKTPKPHPERAVHKLPDRPDQEHQEKTC